MSRVLQVAVESLDMAMFEGQILALLGHNGAGKSTTINMCLGFKSLHSRDPLILVYDSEITPRMCWIC